MNENENKNDKKIPKWMSWLIEETPDKNTKVTEPVQQPQNNTPQNVSPLTPSPLMMAQSVTPAPVVNVDTEKYLSHFNDLMVAADIPGPDYYEYMNTIAGMQSLGLPEQSQYKAAFAAFSAQGITKETLLTTAGQYIDVLETDKLKYTTALEKKTVETVSALDEEVIALDKRKAEIAETINDLLIEQQEIEGRFKLATEELDAAKNGSAAKKQAYESVLARFVDRIKSDIDKIGQYL